MARTIATQDKDADARLDYLFDWSAQMDADTDGIASATVSAPSGIGLGSPTVTASTVQVYVSGGSEGTTYAIVNHIWTTGGRQDDKVLNLTIVQQPSVSHSFVVEDGTAKANANSYATVAQADTYHAAHLYASTWSAATDPKKQKALMWATRLLDEWMEFDGVATSDTQALQWPRYSAVDRKGWPIDGDEIPTDLVNATAELARLLLVEDRTAFDEDDVPRGFKRIKAGSLELEMDGASRANAKPVIPEHVRRMLSAFSRPIGGNVIKLARV